MKKTLVLIAFAFLLFSCHKDTVNTPSTPSYVASVKQYATHVFRIDSLYYDTSNNIARIIHYDYDSSGSSPLLDTIQTVFSYTTDSTPPVSYSQNGVAHKLMYDSESRIIKDSTEDGSVNTTSFSYGTNIVVYRKENFVPSHSITVDSLFFSNGNIATVLSYNPSSGGTGSLSEDYQYSSYTAINPLYHATIANTIGPLLHFMFYDYYYQVTLADILSQKMATRVHATGTALAFNPADLTGVLQKDAQGRVIATIPYYQGVLPVNGKIVYTYY